MKLPRLLAFAFLLLGPTLRAPAEYHELKEPWLAFPKDFPASTKTNIQARLRHPDCKFLGGSALNAWTSLQYAGDTRALNLFMSGLAKCPGITLSVLFYHGENDDSDWRVTHMASHDPHNVCVRVNLKSTHIKLDALVIPDIKGQEPDQPK